MEIRELAPLAFQRSTEKGFGTPGMENDPDQAIKVHMLIVSEVAEATEAVRNRELPFYIVGDESHSLEPQGLRTDLFKVPPHAAERIAASGCKPEGEAVELADAVIRIADWFGRHGWDLETVILAKMAYNRTRTHRHGNKAA